MAKKKQKEIPALVRVSSMKEYIKGAADVNVSGELVEAVNGKLAEVLADAVDRCLGNNRKTVRPVDL